MYFTYFSSLIALGAVETSSAAEERARLEAEFSSALAKDESPQPAAPSSGPTLRLIDISLDLLAAAGGSSVEEPLLRDLQAGGHDPKNRGFTLQNAELTLSGVVDPYLRGDANLVFQISEEGETIVELEEAYLTTLALPGNLQIKAGQFLTAFGRLNPTHPHAWDFVDQPVVNTRFLGGDGLRAPGIQLAWLTPLPFFFELSASVQNAQGETAASFRFVPGESVAGYPIADSSVKRLGDLLYFGHAKLSFDLGEETTFVLGGSAAFGPNATGDDTRTMIGGADLYLKWKPLDNESGWPFLTLQSEVMVRRYETPAAPLEDFGAYGQVVWGFARPWSIGARYDFAKGETSTAELYTSEDDPLRNKRHRASAALTYYPTEFSKLRLQYNFDRTSTLPDETAHSVYLQAEIIFGAHGAHKF